MTSLLLPSAFFDVWMTVGLAAASNFVMSLFSLVLPPVYIAKRVYLILISQTFAAIVTVIIFYSVRDFGFLGAALAVFVGVTALVFTQLIVNVKLTSVLPIPFDIWRLAIAVLILGFSCCATFFIGSLKGFQYFVFTGGVVLMAGAVMFFILPDRRCLLNGFADRMSKLLRRRRALNG